MDVKPRELVDFETSEGKIPFRDWLDSLRDKQTRAIIDARLVRVRRGNFGHCKPVGEGVQELKIDFGPGFRVYFGLDGEVLVVLLSGGSKATQSKDIKQAKAYWREYRSLR
jgi:putative addiction module killer protein